MSYLGDITLKSDRYITLFNKWNEAKKVLTSPGNFDNQIKDVKNYSVEEFNDLLLVKIFGFKIYLRFKHNFKMGFIQYFIKDEDNSNEPIRILFELQFDDLGNFKNKEYEMSHIPEFKSANIIIINRILDEITKEMK